jgi:two-component system, cell cycle response regulator
VLSRNLEKSLHRALACANERRHEYATLEHLLLSLTEDEDAVAVFRASGVELERLRREVLNYVDNELANLVAARSDDAKPTANFQRVLQRAAIHVQSSGREEVTGANVLVAMFAERESHAVYFLQEQDMTRFDAVNYIHHDIAKAPGPSPARLKQVMEEWRLRQESRFAGRDTGAVEDAGRAMILIVEEDHFAAARMAEILRSVGHTVTCAASCAEGQNLLGSDCELIIVSLSMASGDPLRLVTQCRASETFRQLPILLIADETDLLRLAKGLDLGANDYLIRPVNRSELVVRTGTQIRRKRSQDRLQQNYGRTLGLALTDELTGLYNRRYLFAHLDELIERVNQDGISTALLLLDIDRFKSINDTYGHAAGDGVLREVATRARNGVRSGDLVARFGGQEFVVVMPETDLWIARSLAERLRVAVAIEPFIVTVSGKELTVTISIGVTWTNGTGDDRHKVLKRADEALHSAKRSGRNRVVVRAPE